MTACWTHPLSLQLRHGCKERRVCGSSGCTDFGASAPAPSPRWDRRRFDELQSVELQPAAPARAASFGARVMKGVRPIDLRAG
jgi:hypothetical protein